MVVQLEGTGSKVWMQGGGLCTSQALLRRERPGTNDSMQSTRQNSNTGSGLALCADFAEVRWVDLGCVHSVIFFFGSFEMSALSDDRDAKFGFCSGGGTVGAYLPVAQGER